MENYDVSASSVVVAIIISVFMIITMWKIFTKANEHGWASIVPIYNLYVEYKIAFGNGWYFLFLLLPFVNIVFEIMLCFKLAKAFGKGVGFGFGLLFLPIIFYPILAFGSAEYQN